MAREAGDQALIKFGLDVLTLAVLAILITAPTGAVGIGLAGPRLLTRQVKGQNMYTFIFHVIFLIRFVYVFIFYLYLRPRRNRW